MTIRVTISEWNPLKSVRTSIHLHRSGPVGTTDAYPFAREFAEVALESAIAANPICTYEIERIDCRHEGDNMNNRDGVWISDVAAALRKEEHERREDDAT